jgi:hypothetical protein
MGVDLDLQVERSQGGRRFDVNRSYHLFQQLCQADFREYSRHVCEPKLIDEQIAKEFDDLPEDMLDGYGGKLRYITAGETVGVKPEWECDDTLEMLDYFKKLPPEAKIAMFWN